MKNRDFFLIFLIALVIVSSFLLIQKRIVYPLIDERLHYAQILSFIDGDYTLNPYITTPPGYPLFFAGIAALANNVTLTAIRFFSLIFSLLSVLFFFLIAKKIDFKFAKEKTLQYLFFPILFPFFFLVYTDVFSMLIVLAAFYALLNKKYHLSGIIGFFSLIVRQNNIIWLFFMAWFIYFEDNKFKFNSKILKDYLKKSQIFLIDFVLFIIFIILNKGFAIGDKLAHPTFTFHLGNIYFMLFLFFFLFLPLNISNFRKIMCFIAKNKKIFLLIVVLAIIALLTFTNSHPYNQDQYFLRNILLVFFTLNITWKIIFFIIVVYSILSLLVTKLNKKVFYLIYPLTILYLIPSWLIEPRYYFLPFIFFVLFRENRSKSMEDLTVLFYFIFSGVIMFLITQTKYFL